jgi:hypothetical protein
MKIVPPLKAEDEFMRVAERREPGIDLSLAVRFGFPNRSSDTTTKRLESLLSHPSRFGSSKIVY